MTDSGQLNTKLPTFNKKPRKKEAEKPDTDERDRMGEDDKEETHK